MDGSHPEGPAGSKIGSSANTSAATSSEIKSGADSLDLEWGDHSGSGHRAVGSLATAGHDKDDPHLGPSGKGGGGDGAVGDLNALGGHRDGGGGGARHSRREGPYWAG